MHDRISSVKSNCQQFLKDNYSLEVPEDWLIQCIEFILESDPVRNY